MDVKGGNAELLVRIVHATEVLVAPKYNYTIVDGSIGLGPLKTLNSVVESRVGWINLERFVWNDLRLLPATIFSIIVDF